MQKHRRILVVRTDRVGDVVLATPLIRALRNTFPSAHIAAMVRPHTRAVLEKNPHLDDLLLDDDQGAHRGKRGFWRQVNALRRQRFDTALLLLPTRRLAWILFLAGIRRRVTVGRILYQVLTLMETVSRNDYKPLRHEADYCLDLGRRIGVHNDDLATEIFLSREERNDAQATLEARGITFRDGACEGALVGIHPGHGGSSPNWRVERYVQLAARILDERRDTRIVVTGSPAEIGFTQAFTSIGSDRVTLLAGDLTLRRFMSVVSHLGVLVSSSTGPMHVAAALGVPTVSLFCPLAPCSPALWGPQGNPAEIILPEDDYCQGRCARDPHVCDFEDGIHVDAVARGVLRSLDRST